MSNDLRGKVEFTRFVLPSKSTLTEQDHHEGRSGKPTRSNSKTINCCIYLCVQDIFLKGVNLLKLLVPNMSIFKRIIHINIAILITIKSGMEVFSI